MGVFDLELSWWVFLLLILAGFTAGWIDAVVGGGGLIQLPALLLVPGLTPVEALATNKIGSVFGTGTSSVTYYRSLRPELRSIVPTALTAGLASVLGASFATLLPAQVFTPIIVAALAVVLIITVAKPSLGSVARATPPRFHLLTSLCIGVGIGAYDGLLGPGTGTFLVIALVAGLGYDFLAASAHAKIVNFATNVGALMLFIPVGAVNWRIGVPLAVANALGGFLGARTALKRGARFVRVLFLSVVTALIIKLGLDLLG